MSVNDLKRNYWKSFNHLDVKVDARKTYLSKEEGKFDKFLQMSTGEFLGFTFKN